MKKIILFLICSYSFIAFSQENSEVDDFLSVKYSKKEIKELKKQTPQLYQEYILSFSSGIEIMEYNGKLKEKGNKFKILDITLQEGEKFNYLKYNIDIKKETQYFLINNGNKLVSIKGFSIIK
jgi:hypothetical protein